MHDFILDHLNSEFFYSKWGMLVKTDIILFSITHYNFVGVIINQI